MHLHLHALLPYMLVCIHACMHICMHTISVHACIYVPMHEYTNVDLDMIVQSVESGGHHPRRLFGLV